MKRMEAYAISPSHSITACLTQSDSPRRTELLDYLGNPAAPSIPLPVESESSAMEVDATTLAPVVSVLEKAQEKIVGKKERDATQEEALAVLPEGDIYVSLLVVLWLLDQGKLDAVSDDCHFCPGQVRLDC